MAEATAAALKQKGIFTFETLGQSLEEEQKFVIQDLLTEGSVNLLAGDSGIGKTPLCLTLALCIAGGRPFLGMKVPHPRRVLYCDAESSKNAFHKTVLTLSNYLGFKEVPKNFHVWSPNWDEGQQGIDFSSGLFSKCEWNGFKPEMVFVDPLRVFFPDADLKRDKALEVLKRMRKIAGGLITWLIVHHTRKPQTDQTQRPKSIDEDPHTWFHEVAGQHAIINHVDTRLGVESTPDREGSEMTMGGFVRMLGPINPMYLARSYNDEGDPQGYMRGTSVSLLHPNYREAFFELPREGVIFTFKEARDILNRSDSSCNNMLKRCVSLGLIKKVPGGYCRTD